MFSVASIWEVAIKRALDRQDFTAEPASLRRGLFDDGYDELPITSEHAVATQCLSSLHKDPFDRILVAQSHLEGITPLTTDSVVAGYSEPIRYVG